MTVQEEVSKAFREIKDAESAKRFSELIKKLPKVKTFKKQKFFINQNNSI